MVNIRTGPTIPAPDSTMARLGSTISRLAGELHTSTVATDPDFIAGSIRWREVSAALHSRLRNSIADAVAELMRIFGKTWEQYVLRPAAYVGWTARQHADTYTHEPEIKYLDPETNEELDEAVVKRITTERAEARVTEALLSMHEEGVACGNGIVWVEPVIRRAPGGARLVSVRCRSVPPHEQAVVLERDRSSSDERDVAAWLVRMPIPGASGLYGTARITPTEAVWMDGTEGGLAGKPVWDRATENAPSNPIGDIPAAVFRWSDPDAGLFWANAREELLWQARAVDHGYTQAGETEVTQGHGQWHGQGLKQDAGKIQFGRRVLIETDAPTAGNAGGGKLENVAPHPDMAGALNNLEGYLRVAVASQDGNPATLIRSTAITAQGKEVELDDRAGLRRRHHMQLARIEQRLYDLRRAWLRQLRGAEVLPAARLVVRYAEPRAPQNPLQEVQAAKLWIDLGQEDPYTLYASRMSVPIDEAKRIVDEHFAVSRRLGVLGPAKAETAPQPPDQAGTMTPPPVAKGPA